MSDYSFDDGYLAIATGLFAIFGTTILLPNWGGGRPMMITFSFTTIFAVIGAIWLGKGFGRIRAHFTRDLSLPTVLGMDLKRRLPPIQHNGVHVFASLLFVLLMLNTGVASATVFPGYAPSNVPAQPKLVTDQNPESQVTVHRMTDVMTHLWLVEHLDSGYDVYGDTFGIRQFDWYRPDIAARTESIGAGYTPATKPEIIQVNGQLVEPHRGYILVMGHNDELQVFFPGRFTPPIPLDSLRLANRQKVYSNGESTIYFSSTAD